MANTVIDEIAFGPENLGLPRFEIEERVQEAMEDGESEVRIVELSPIEPWAVTQ